MFVKQLEIHSFRGIDFLDLEFQSRINVLIGVNGVGKSSIIEALRYLLSKYNVEVVKYVMGWSDEIDVEPRHEDIQSRNGSLHIAIKVHFLGCEFQWVKFIDHNRVLNPVGNDELHALCRTIMKRGADGRWNPSMAIPLVVYYPVNRSVLDFSLDLADIPSKFQANALEGAVTGHNSSFNAFFSWFRSLEDLENEERLDRPEYRDRRLEAVRKAIPVFLENITNLRVRRSPLRMTVTKDGQELILNQLSDGEKCLLAMVGDLARRLAIANPGLDNPLEGAGIVLIDEIELHLHPEWQRGVIPKLTRTFPNCQFILSTHSPQVISDVKPECIYMLQKTPQGIIAIHPHSSYGRDSNRILEDLMGVPERPHEIH